MGIGGTAKKIQSLAERAEQLYEQLVELRERTIKLEESVDESTHRVRQLEVESEKQQVLLRAIAAEHGIDVDRVLAEAAIEEAEPPGGAEANAGDAEADAPGTPDADAADTDGGAGGEATGESAESTGETDEPTVIDSSGEPVE